jgi:hypothetical protein
MATLPRRTLPDRREAKTIRATIDAHAPHARQEFRAGLAVVALFLAGLAIIFSVPLPG